MKGARKFKDYLKEELKGKEFKGAFEKEEIYADLALQIVKLRQEKGLTQTELANVLHTTQQTISRLEDPHNKSLSLNTLIEIAHALDKHLKIQFI